MPDESSERLKAWRRSLEVAARLHLLLRDCRDFGFRQQTTNLADSISATIAEGTERLTKPKFRQFLGYSKGSAGYPRSRLYIAEPTDTLRRPIALSFSTSSAGFPA